MNKIKTSKVQIIAVIFLFMLLWLPLGQYAFLIKNWMKIGVYALPFLFVGFFMNRPERKDQLSDLSFLSLIMLTIYIMHQFEEHWIDLFGNHYAFYTNVNDLIKSVIGTGGKILNPLTPEAIFVINTSLVWLLGLLAISRSICHIFTTLAMNAIIVVNAMTHIMAGLVRQAYNPGLLTSIVIFLPFGIYFFRKILKTDPSLKKQVHLSILWAVLAHVIIVSGMLAANFYGIISQVVYFIILVIWSCIPVFMFRNSRLALKNTENNE